MIFLEREKREFARTHREFAAAYVDAVLELRRVYEERSAVRDVDTPLHHRKSPEEMLGMVKAKCHRLNSLFAKGDLAENTDTLKRVIEECTDAANYALFISALCSMLLKERTEGQAEVAAVIDGMLHKPWPKDPEGFFIPAGTEIQRDATGRQWALLPEEAESEYDKFSTRMEEPAP